MATKKTAKKATTKVVAKVVSFNKKNTLALADLIFSDKGGQISCLKLCEGNLSTKEGGRTLHCAVGEAYFQFVSKNMKSVTGSDEPTENAIEALLSVAQLKKSSDREKLRNALETAVESNDESHCSLDSDALGDYVVRAKEVATTFRKEVAPLLK